MSLTSEPAWRDMETGELVHAVIPSPNFNERQQPISMLVLHYTEMKPVETALHKLCDPEAGVSAHYLISEEGAVTQLVSETKRAWHAGKSFWRGNRDINSASVGIELDHPGHAPENGGYRDFAEAQFEALVPLVARIIKDYDIPRANVVGHSDVAPMRKTDPGELFPWERLAEYGLCLPRPAKIEPVDPWHNEGAFILGLERFGYDITEGRKAIEAFERRWRPHKIEGKPDAQLGAILWHLLLERDQGRAR
ncbi:MAG: N-acetylmuramoyl-L-alanine amidase [Erythrobacter sp.]|uniref:N-acetylmuramoyl-L-alanine amidase n=1 Tax=Erythrobacter sp. TaxID=1042 RepID=UPI002603F7B6|nr:N-acetylmuramoyl-L-alanine amidase [Erythrobacter sp.]MDJ0978888.1 N-acetylmuramoyl-L-alanine amidase [Erythrobacter sp.]